jgi:hypothetical protein
MSPTSPELSKGMRSAAAIVAAAILSPSVAISLFSLLSVVVAPPR